MEEYSNDKSYMVLVIITFLAFACAFGFAFAEWSEFNDSTQPVEIDIFPVRAQVN